MTLCKNCGKGIKWFKDLNDKWVPLEADCNLEYESPEEVDMDEVLQWKHKCTAVLTCNKGCGTQIYFDPNNKSPSGKVPKRLFQRDTGSVISSYWLLKSLHSSADLHINHIGFSYIVSL